MIADLATAVTLALGSSATASVAVSDRSAAVELRLDQYVVSGDDQPNATLLNTGDVRLVHGIGFKLERRVGGTWRWANRNQAFILPLLELAPGATSRPEPIGFYGPPGSRRELRPGFYRVTKAASPARTHPGRPVLRVSAIFRVVADAG